jgi:N-acetylmuramoyl-L-alanine amidase
MIVIYFLRRIILAIKIFIDQGHNPSGFNAGAEGNGLREQDITYIVGIYLANILNADDRFEARTSRTTPEQALGYSNTSSLAERVRLANSWPANYFVSIHCNSNENPAINGTEIYVERNYTQAYYLAERILPAIVSRVGTNNNGLRLNPTLYVLRNTNMPAILVELAYITNYSDAQKLSTRQYDFAYAIYTGMLDYFGFKPQV